MRLTEVCVKLLFYSYLLIIFMSKVKKLKGRDSESLPRHSYNVHTRSQSMAPACRQPPSSPAVSLGTATFLVPNDCILPNG